jgi:hypothetical protein
VTAAAAEPAADAGGRGLLAAARASYGCALLIAPGAVIYLATGHPAGRRARRLARLLGARHLIQATVTSLAPLPCVLTVGAGVDGLHAASMVMLAAADRGARRAALTDAVAESVFAAAGVSAAGRAPAPAVTARTRPFGRGYGGSG